MHSHVGGMSIPLSCPGPPIPDPGWYLCQQCVPQCTDVLLSGRVSDWDHHLHRVPDQGETEHLQLLDVAEDGAGQAELGKDIQQPGATCPTRWEQHWEHSKESGQPPKWPRPPGEVTLCQQWL